MVHSANAERIARGNWEIESEIARTACLLETISESLEEIVGSDPANDTDTRDGLPILNRSDSVCRRAKFCHALIPNCFNVALATS